jgi:hypothetical protein
MEDKLEWYVEDRELEQGLAGEDAWDGTGDEVYVIKDEPYPLRDEGYSP